MRIRDQSGGRAPHLQGHAGVGVLQVFVLLLVVACGGGIVTPAPSSDRTLAPGETASAETGGPTAKPPDPPDDPFKTFFAWILSLGASGPNAPPEISVYEDIELGTENSCQRAFDAKLDGDNDALYEGAAAVCLAALWGNDGLWPVAEDALRLYPERPTACLDRAIFDLLTSGVEMHRADRTAKFRKGGKVPDGQRANVPLTCPTIEKVTVTRTETLGNPTIVVQGSNLNQVDQIVYAPVPCPQPADRDDGSHVGAEGNDKTIQGLVEGDQEARVATHMWVGVETDVPDDWVADATCVPVTEAQAQPSDDPPTPAPTTPALTPTPTT